MLGLDVAALAAKHQIQYAAVLAGDGDLMPAIEAARAEGISVWLVHGPANTYAFGATPPGAEISESVFELPGGWIEPWISCLFVRR